MQNFLEGVAASHDSFFHHSVKKGGGVQPINGKNDIFFLGGGGGVKFFRQEGQWCDPFTMV